MEDQVIIEATDIDLIAKYRDWIYGLCWTEEGWTSTSKEFHLGDPDGLKWHFHGPYPFVRDKRGEWVKNEDKSLRGAILDLAEEVSMFLANHPDAEVCN